MCFPSLQTTDREPAKDGRRYSPFSLSKDLPWYRTSSIRHSSFADRTTSHRESYLRQINSGRDVGCRRDPGSDPGRVPVRLPPIRRGASGFDGPSSGSLPGELELSSGMSSLASFVFFRGLDGTAVESDPDESPTSVSPRDVSPRRSSSGWVEGDTGFSGVSSGGAGGFGFGEATCWSPSVTSGLADSSSSSTG